MRAHLGTTAFPAGTVRVHGQERRESHDVLHRFRLKRCRSCGVCSERKNKCQTCKSKYQINWSVSCTFHVLSPLWSLINKQANPTLARCWFHSLVWLFSCHFTTTFLYLVSKLPYDDLCLADMFSTSPNELSPYVKVNHWQHDSVKCIAH